MEPDNDELTIDKTDSEFKYPSDGGSVPYKETVSNTILSTLSFVQDTPYQLHTSSSGSPELHVQPYGKPVMDSERSHMIPSTEI